VGVFNIGTGTGVVVGKSGPDSETTNTFSSGGRKHVIDWTRTEASVKFGITTTNTFSSDVV
jgi:hypothetical protein